MVAVAEVRGETKSRGEQRKREKTKAQLLFHRLQEKGQLSAQSVPQSSVIRLTIGAATMSL